MTILLIYDASQGDILTRRQLLEPAVADLEGFVLESYTSRNEMLARIGGSAQGERFVVLVDLATDDSDRRYTGFEIIDTMNRNPELRERTIRVVLTRFFGVDMVEHANDLGAHALINFAWLQQSASGDIAETLRDLAGRRPNAQAAVPYTFDAEPGVEEPLDPLHRAMLSFGIIGDGVGWNGRSTLECLIAIAEDVPNKLIDSHNRQHARKLSGKLSRGLIPHGTKPEMARYLLLHFAPPVPRQIEPVWLPDLDLVTEWMQDPEIRAATWLPPRELDLLRMALQRFSGARVSTLDASPRSRTNSVLQRGEFGELVKSACAILSQQGVSGQADEVSVDVSMRRMLYTVKIAARDVHTLRAEASGGLWREAEQSRNVAPHRRS